MNWSSSAASLHEVTLRQGTIRYRDLGSGPTLVFVHGVLVNGTLWREVVPFLTDHFRCIVPDLPLGAHQYPLAANADRSPTGMAALLADFLQALDISDAILVANDTGGAISQIAITRHPDRIVGLVLTNCDAYHAFFPWPLSPFQHGARLFGENFGRMLRFGLQSRFAQRQFLKLVATRQFDETTLDAYFRPFLDNGAVRSDLMRFLATMSNRDTLEAARHFSAFHYPVLIAWGRSDRFFTSGLARRLAHDFPRAELHFIDDARAFVPEDQPRRLAEMILADRKRLLGGSG